jgi:hypothetical protein
MIWGFWAMANVLSVSMEAVTGIDWNIKIAGSLVRFATELCMTFRCNQALTGLSGSQAPYQGRPDENLAQLLQLTTS